jgi:aryl-alcohol dehydrogenase-like predicted oxidoreductase
MNYRDFKGTSIAEVGLGTWQLGSADWGKVDEAESFRILDAYIGLGGNFIDTADVYGMSESESVIGRFLKTCTKPVYVATKLGRRHDGTNGWPQNFTYDGMKRQVEDSLEHLDISQIFLEQLHCIPTEEMRSGKVFDHLRKLQEEGLITHFGASVETVGEALLCLQQDGIASLQIIFNLFRQHVADELFARAKEKNIALIVRVPLASGLLSGKFNADTHFNETDHRSYNANGEAFNAGETFSGIEFTEGVALAAKISTLLPKGNPAAQSIRWILDHPEVTTVIPGATKVSQVISNVSATDLPPIGAHAHRRLRDLYDSEILAKIRGHY